MGVVKTCIGYHQDGEWLKEIGQIIKEQFALDLVETSIYTLVKTSDKDAVLCLDDRMRTSGRDRISQIYNTEYSIEDIRSAKLCALWYEGKKLAVSELARYKNMHGGCSCCGCGAVFSGDLLAIEDIETSSQAFKTSTSEWLFRENLVHTMLEMGVSDDVFEKHVILDQKIWLVKPERRVSIDIVKSSGLMQERFCKKCQLDGWSIETDKIRKIILEEYPEAWCHTKQCMASSCLDNESYPFIARPLLVVPGVCAGEIVKVSNGEVDVDVIY